MEYFINEVTLPCSTKVIALMKNGIWRGVGHCQGWYGAEYYDDVDVLATVCVNGGNVEKCKAHFVTIQIQHSKLREHRFEADSDDLAFQEFEKYLTDHLSIDDNGCYEII